MKAPVFSVPLVSRRPALLLVMALSFATGCASSSKVKSLEAQVETMQGQLRQVAGSSSQLAKTQGSSEEGIQAAMQELYRRQSASEAQVEQMVKDQRELKSRLDQATLRFEEQLRQLTVLQGSLESYATDFGRYEKEYSRTQTILKNVQDQLASQDKDSAAELRELRSTINSNASDLIAVQHKLNQEMTSTRRDLEVLRNDLNLRLDTIGRDLATARQDLQGRDQTLRNALLRFGEAFQQNQAATGAEAEKVNHLLPQSTLADFDATGTPAPPPAQR